MTTAVTIKAIMTYTEQTRASVPVAIPPKDLEPLLVSGLVRLEHLEPSEDGGHQIAVESGEIRDAEQP